MAVSVATWGGLGCGADRGAPGSRWGRRRGWSTNRGRAAGTRAPSPAPAAWPCSWPLWRRRCWPSGCRCPARTPRNWSAFWASPWGTFLFVVGYWTTALSCAPGPQYLAQAVAALIAIACLVFIERVMNPFTDQLTIFPYWLCRGLYPDLDHGHDQHHQLFGWLDGLAAGVGAIVSALLAVHMLREGQYSVALLPLALLGATLGLLPFNFSPARIFLGSGSLILGYAIATLGIAAGAKLALLLLVLTIPIVDVAWLMISRLRAGQSIGQADRRHLHFRLLDLGLSQRQVVLALLCLLHRPGRCGAADRLAPAQAEPPWWCWAWPRWPCWPGWPAGLLS